MAVVFPQVMTALLAKSAITNYFRAILRRRIDAPRWTGPWPVIAVYVTDNLRERPAGGGAQVLDANYAAILVAKMPADKGQDQLIADMVDALGEAARTLVYNTGGFAADVTLGAWASDDNTGAQQGDIVWVDVPLTLAITPV